MMRRPGRPMPATGEGSTAIARCQLCPAGSEREHSRTTGNTICCKVPLGGAWYRPLHELAHERPVMVGRDDVDSHFCRNSRAPGRKFVTARRPNRLCMTTHPRLVRHALPVIARSAKAAAEKVSRSRTSRHDDACRFQNLFRHMTITSNSRRYGIRFSWTR
jgi:hypothetical protein